MQIPLRTIALGLLLASSGMAVRAQSKAPEGTRPINATATNQSIPMDLSLHPAAAPQSTPTNAALNPAAAAQPTPMDAVLHPVSAPQSTSIDAALKRPAVPQSTPTNAALNPAALPQSTPINAALNPTAAPQSGPIDLALQSASAEVKSVARWVIESRDNVGMPYLLIDKVNARVFAFNAAGQLQGATPALLGMARGDRLLAPNDAPMSAMPPQVRVTPAGRFVSRLAIDSHGKELLVLDYDASISLHAVVKGTPKEHRAERLKSATVEDNRISFGCINVPGAFYKTFVSPAFTGTKGVVYVLPETGPASALFGVQPVGTTVSGAQQGSPALNVRTAPMVPAPDAR